MLAGVVAGPALTENWCNDKRPIDFFDVKADIHDKYLDTLLFIVLVVTVELKRFPE